MLKLMSRYAMNSASRVLIARFRPTSLPGFEPIRTGITWRKFEYRNLAKLSLNDETQARKCMSDETYEKICTQARKEADLVSPHVDFTFWIEAIREATIVELSREDPWTDNQALIQVRRMSAKDLESQADLPQSKHEYEDTLDVIKLPLPIPLPAEEYPTAPQFLFIRPDEYALFKCFTQRKWCILTGNPGISKSWFQWKFILFCYRLDLFDRFSPVLEERPVERLKTEPFIPKLIVRTMAGCRSLFFFVGRNDQVLLVHHTPQKLDLITDANSTILWEPASSSTPVYYEGVEAHIIVTVSPDKDRIHEFKKRAKMFYMPCPGELQIRLMGQVYRRFATELENCPSDAEIHERVMNFGPFIRTALCWDSDELKEFIDERAIEINDLVTDPAKLRSRIQVMQPATGKSLSHRSAIFVIHRNSTAPFLGYTVCDYDFSCVNVLRLTQVAIAQMRIDVVKTHLIAINRGEIGLSERLHIFLERILELYTLDKGIKWDHRRMQLEGNNRQTKWTPFKLSFKKVERTKTFFQNMEPGVLYYPDDTTFPLVDLYYKDKYGKLFGIQATMAEKHAKDVSVYQSFYDEIGTCPRTVPLQLNYLIMPCNTDHFSKPYFPPSQFWENVKSEEWLLWKKNISFFALVPPSNFEAKKS